MASVVLVCTNPKSVGNDHEQAKSVAMNALKTTESEEFEPLGSFVEH